MALEFHSVDDLTAIRPDILSYGVTDFEVQMTESETIIKRALESRWYRNVATDKGLNWRTTTFDSTLILNANAQLGRVAAYKSLELIYLYLQKESPEPDAFERQSLAFAKRYKEELNEVLTVGIDYDWDESGDIAAGENIQPRIRRLIRV